ncbi:MAG: flagellar hook-associated protein FlgK [Methylococcaceae bacterium]|jgi:flagellar hook-associated protein 1
MADTITIGLSALVAAQAGVNTTGNNIANASTVGYSRERVLQNASANSNGTQVTDIQRIYDDFLASQKLSAQSSYSQLQAQNAQLQKITTMLSDPSVGIAADMQSFFTSLQAISITPNDTTSRQSLLSNADTLVSGFKDAQTVVDGISKDVNTQISNSVNNINTIAKQIASLNSSIFNAQQSANPSTVNTLLDSRDTLLADLSKMIQVKVVSNGNSTSVFIGNGQPLVMGTSFNQLDTISSSTNTNNIEVAFNINGIKTPISQNNLSGGTLTGLIAFRSNTLPTVQNAIGRIALGLASSMNAINTAGFTLNGTAGGELFTVPSINVAANTGNKGNATIGATYGDISKISTSDYSLQKVADGNYNLIRISDNTLLESGSSSKIYNAATSEGLNISFPADEGAIGVGDQFTIRPTANVAGALSVAASNVNDIAAASSAGIVGDNSNVLKMIALQTNKTLANGSLSLTSAYANMVGDIGSKSQALISTSTTANAVLTQASSALDSVAGVNLDEEAANLLKYQQAYQAAGKLIAASKLMFDTLFNIA